MSKYEAVIGLEVHVQLNTASKIFCSARSRFGDDPNQNTDPVTFGLPGTLPVLNKAVLDSSIKVGLALNCQINEKMKFDRKHYFYPDLPKAYQISQFDMPIAYDGYIEIEDNGERVKIGVTRAHVEEDAGKLLHEGIEDGSYVDYNRAGTPLVEIVSEPDLRTAEQAYQYLTSLKAILSYLDVSDCNMEEGSLRCDANVSIRPIGQKEFGTKTEIKNLNSFKAVQKSIDYEILRQIEAVEEGEKIRQETRLWNDNKNITVLMRTKEGAADYRYFPDPDLVPFSIARELVAKVKEGMPELPFKRQERLMKDYAISEYDAKVLTQDKALANYFEETVAEKVSPKLAANWIANELLGQLNAKKMTLDHSGITPKKMANLVNIIENGSISGKIAKDVMLEMFESDLLPEEIVKEKGWLQVSNEDDLSSFADQVIANNPGPVADVKAGKDKAIGRLVGEMMKLTKGKANPAVVNKILRDKLTP